MTTFNFDFDWYDMLIEGGLVREGYRYYTGQKMHPYIPKMQIDGYIDECCQMSSITKIYLPKDDEQFQLGEFNHIGGNEEAFYSALLNGLHYLKRKGIKRVLVESSNKFMICDVLNVLFYNKAKRKQYWYVHELMCVLNDFRLFAIRWNPDPRPFHETSAFKKKKSSKPSKKKFKDRDYEMNEAVDIHQKNTVESYTYAEPDEEMNECEEPEEPLDPTIAHIYT